jgi:predicted MFS family arabinose efflux permease
MAGIFLIVTTEILPIGLLTTVGESFDISAGTAGLMMTMPGFLAAVAAPVVTVTTARIDRRLMLCVLMSLLVLANLLAAVATSYWLMLVSRVLVGVVIGGFWSIGSGLSARLVDADQVGRATAVIFSAVPFGSVLGVPAGTLIGHVAGWRAAFAILAVASLAVVVALTLTVPALPARTVTRLRILGSLLTRPAIRTGLVATFLVVLAHFGTYTYVTPFLEQVSRVSPGLVSAYLLAYGVAGIAGNFLAGAAIARSLRGTFAVAALVLALSTLLFPLSGPAAVVPLVTWGLAYGAVPVCSGSWFARAAPDHVEAASVLFTSSFQATISAGALVGGLVVDASGPSTVLLLAGLVALLVLMPLCRPETSRAG